MSGPSPDDLLADAGQLVSEAEQRREQQVRLIAELAGNPDDLVYAERVLREIETTLEVARTHRAILQTLLNDETPGPRPEAVQASAEECGR